MLSPKIKAAIFDLDGTLMDSMRVWDKIDVDFLKKRGLNMPSDYKEAITSLSFRETAVYTIKRFGLNETPEAIQHEWNEMAIFEYSHNVRLKPGAREYLDRLRASGVRLGVATSSPGRLTSPALANNGIRDYFGAICTADDVERGKDFPDIFLFAAEKLGARPEDCIVFEDILQAVESAKSVGMTVYGVYDDSSAGRWEEIKRAADGFLYDFNNAPLPD
jgi:HAD superfamily hydrolase (TIGR01509 family)